MRCEPRLNLRRRSSPLRRSTRCNGSTLSGTSNLSERLTLMLLRRHAFLLSSLGGEEYDVVFP